MENSKNNKVLLIVAYNERNLGVRYIANFLEQNGYEPTIIFLKTFISLFDEKEITEEEIQKIKEIIEEEKFLFVGLSIHSSSIISELDKVIKMLNNETNIPFIMGGSYPTVLPKYCASMCDMVLRGEGENNILMLAEKIKEGKDWKNIPGGCYFDKNENYIENELATVYKDLDKIAFPLINSKQMYLIDGNNIKQVDPQLTSDFYETSASRGCPFKCSYCCADALSSVYKDKEKFHRFRKVDSIITELKQAIKENPNIKEIRFWDEVFPTQKEWLKEFSEKYKKEIGLKFHIYGHPMMINEEAVKMLKEAGLYLIAVGFQSGSKNVRQNIFNRPESNEQIINASKILVRNKIPRIYYDLMICHPLETLEELKETFNMCLKLEPPFRLQLHGLGLLPGAKILNLLIEKGIYTKQELHKITTAPFEEQDAFLLGPIRSYYANDTRKEIWAGLIYLTQFQDIREEIIKLSKNPYLNIRRIKELQFEKRFLHKYLKEIRFCDYQQLYKRPLNIIAKQTNLFLDTISKKG